ncbi:uncharacterized protein LOC125945329 isoform X2 [Dermacentor silvarum]|nr:uncharacterized protein LOC125945329 isoform X2 [Dermacentor silvarum]
MYDSLVKQAVSDPTLLNVEQLERLACAVCHTAAQSIGHPEPAAMFCRRIALTPSSTRDEAERAGDGPQSHSDYEQGEDRHVMYDSLVKQAVSDPTLLNMEQLERLACAVCHTAAQSIGHAEPAAMFCRRISLATIALCGRPGRASRASTGPAG